MKAVVYPLPGGRHELDLVKAQHGNVIQQTSLGTNQEVFQGRRSCNLGKKILHNYCGIFSDQKIPKATLSIR
jgi:hypothetical protein